LWGKDEDKSKVKIQEKWSCVILVFSWLSILLHCKCDFENYYMIHWLINKTVIIKHMSTVCLFIYAYSNITTK